MKLLLMAVIFPATLLMNNLVMNTHTDAVQWLRSAVRCCTSSRNACLHATHAVAYL